MAQVLLTTTATVTLKDLGDRTFTHPVVDLDLLTEFSEDRLQDSVSLQVAIDAGDITLQDENNNALTVVRDIGAHRHYIADDLHNFSMADLNSKVTDGTLDTTSDPRSPTAHAGSHLTGQSDEIDGDKMNIDFVPSSYTRDATATEADVVEDLTAHLKGIDNALNGVAGNEKFVFSCASNKNTTDRYLDGSDGIPTNVSGFVLHTAATLVGIAVKTDGAETYDVIVRKNGGAGAEATLNVAAVDKESGAFNVAFLAEDEVQVYIDGDNIAKPHVQLYFTNT
jgi:hypothetical protein